MKKMLQDTNNFEIGYFRVYFISAINCRAINCRTISLSRRRTARTLAA